MKTITIDVKSKGAVVGQATVDLPESLDEAKADEPKNLAAMHYGLKVKAANAARAEATGGPKSIPRILAAKLKENPELRAKMAKLLGMSEEELAQ